jgi:hypothetical protein
MQKVEDYRQHGEECRAMARRSRSPEERAMLLKIAETWDELAAYRAAQIARQQRVTDVSVGDAALPNPPG